MADMKLSKWALGYRKRLGRWLAPLAALALGGCATTAQHETNGPALWSVSDADTKIYLFGTIHLLPAGHEWRTPVIERAIAESDELVVEVALSDDQIETAQA